MSFFQVHFLIGILFLLVCDKGQSKDSSFPVVQTIGSKIRLFADDTSLFFKL